MRLTGVSKPARQVAYSKRSTPEWLSQTVFSTAHPASPGFNPARPRWPRYPRHDRREAAMPKDPKIPAADGALSRIPVDEAGELIGRLRHVLLPAGLDCQCRETLTGALDRFSLMEKRRIGRR